MYNGYSNYETWNICLWLCNDEKQYKCCLALKEEYSNKDGKITEDDAKSIVKEIYPEGTPDFRSDSEKFKEWKKTVNWEEITNCINELS
jgi:hypothetical protein